MMISSVLGAYADLADEPGPPALIEALKLYGIKETPGAADNNVILEWADELGGFTKEVYRHDVTPWCGLYCGIVMKRAGYVPPRMLIRAREWLTWGSEVTQPALMDVLVFWRQPSGGHVGFYAGEDNEAFHVLGGNQGDAVTIVRIERTRMIGARRPLYPNIRQIYRAAQGALPIALV